MTVVLEIPSRSAMRDFGTPSAASLLINAQSSKVITLQSLSAHLSPPKLFSFRAPPTIEVMTADETVLGGGRYATDQAGFAAMRRYVSQFPDRVWAIEGCAGIGHHVAMRLLTAGEEVIDVPPKLSARMRVFATGQGRKTDATDAHSVALAGTRMAGLRPVVNDEQLAVLRVLVDRRRSLGEDHTRMISQLHALLLELIPGGAKKDLSAAQAKALLVGVRPRDVVGKTRRRVAAELIADLERIYTRKKARTRN